MDDNTQAYRAETEVHALESETLPDYTQLTICLHAQDKYPVISIARYFRTTNTEDEAQIWKKTEHV